ncbi:diphthine synthase [Tribonema minus]|uniref:diphthine methyl ester synthase n=1 Tax=Tribonema minus TaxID=303371 RepID=A0A835ZI35_9STRA|nr:diphthine synthase [Tribonema minus]
MVLYFIGLGLGDEKDITVRGLEAVKGCRKVVLERYTSVLGVDKEKLEAFYGRPIIYADRETVESEAESIYESAATEDVAFLVVGDPFCATTHTDLMMRAHKLGIKVEVVHNASVMGAAASCGLQLYNFGHTVSLCLWDKEMDWTPSSFYEKVLYNRKGGMHTLCLLDIKVKEPDFAEMAKGRVRYLPPRFMTIAQAVEQLLEVETERKAGAYTKDTMAVGLARLGQPSQLIVSGTLDELITVDFGAPLHSLVIAGETHPIEEEVLAMYAITADTPRAAPPSEQTQHDESGRDGEQ